MKKPAIQPEKIDIGKQANDLETYSDGNLQRLDQEKEIKHRWFKEKTIVLISTITITSILLASLYLLIFVDDSETKNWAKQSLTVLLGFAAGAIWSSSQGSSKD